MSVQAAAIEFDPAYTSKQRIDRERLVVVWDLEPGSLDVDIRFEDAVEELLHDFSATERMQLSWAFRREAAAAIR